MFQDFNDEPTNIVPLSYELKSGDQIEIIKSENTKPSANWLDYVKTSRAKSKIRTALKEEKKLLAEDGKEILRRKLKQLKIDFNEKNINNLANYFNLRTSLDLFYRIGIGKIDNSSLKKFAASNKNRLLNYLRKKISKSNSEISHNEKEIKNNFDQIVFTNEEEKLDYTLAKCCNPIPGDNVFGFLTIKEGIKVHKKTCSNSISLQSKFAYRIIKAKWIDSTQEDFSSIIKISGIDNIGIVSEITRIISNNLSINMKKMSFDTIENTFAGTIKLQVKNKSILDELIQKLKKINGIEKVNRE